MPIALGQAASHSAWLEQEPKPSASICSTIATTRRSRSGWPWGSRLRWATLAAVKSEAEAFGQAATQAPQPMQAAASMARSAASLGTGMALPSGALPVRTETKPPAAMIRSKAPRSTIRSLTTGNAAARQGSMVTVSPSRKLRMWSWQVVVCGRGPCGRAVDHDPALAADPLAAVVVEGDRLLAAADQALVDDVEHLQERHVGADVAGLVGDELALATGGPSAARR